MAVCNNNEFILKNYALDNICNITGSMAGGFSLITHFRRVHSYTPYCSRSCSANPNYTGKESY
jgi:hypothetical protein